MSNRKSIAQYQDGQPPQLLDDFVFERNNVTYRIPFSALKDAIVAAVGPSGTITNNNFTISDEPGIEEPIIVPGPPGNPGIDGSSGIVGRDGNIIVIEAESPEDVMVIPGPKGDVGVAGVGTPGITGPAGPFIWIPHFDELSLDDLPLFPPATEGNNVVYLGKVTGTGVTVGPLSWNELFDHIIFEYQIGGYNGGTPVGRLLCANGAITTTGLTNGSGLLEGATVNNTSISKPGVPLAVTLSNIARSGWGVIRGVSGALKQIDIQGMSGNPAVGTAPSIFAARSFFSDLGTNLPIKNIQLSVYDTLITTAVSTQTFTATTFIRAWGLRINPK